MQMIVGALFMASLCWMAVQSIHPDDMVFTMIFLAGTALFCGVLMFKSYQRGQYNEPILIIDEEGLTDNISKYPVGFIPWEDVTRMSITRSRGNQQTLHVHLKNSDMYFKRMLAKDKSGRIKKSHPKTFAIQIHDFYLPMNAEKLMATIDTFRKAQVGVSS
jgi:hypothetical protein